MKAGRSGDLHHGNTQIRSISVGVVIEVNEATDPRCGLSATVVAIRITTTRTIGFLTTSGRTAAISGGTAAARRIATRIITRGGTIPRLRIISRSRAVGAASPFIGRIIFPGATAVATATIVSSGRE